MTAMMCFFLVMWLINAANEETKGGGRQLFQPGQADRPQFQQEGPGGHRRRSQFRRHDRRGADRRAEQGTAEGSGNAGPATVKNASETAAVEGHSDQHLFADPYAVLAEIATDTGIMQNVSAKGEGGAQTSGPSTGASGGESYRDPFAPDFWSQQVAAIDTAETAPEKSGADEPTRTRRARPGGG